MQSLIFFDENGNSINFNYNSNLNQYTGSLIFPENSSDTFKTIPLYILEKVPSFEFTDVSLTLDKFQLFNEYGYIFSGGEYLNESVTDIENVIETQNTSIYSKWIYGNNFENKFQIGSKIKFNKDVYSKNIDGTLGKKLFYNNTLYTVHDSKQNAIMIITSGTNASLSLNNAININNYNIDYSDITISNSNSISIKNITGTISNWSEPNFDSKLVVNKSLNIINSKYNNNTYIISDITSSNNIYYNYKLSSDLLSFNTNYIIEINDLKGIDRIYYGGINIMGFTISLTESTQIRGIKNGDEILISNSINNQYSIIISGISQFSTIFMGYYNKYSQIYYNNQVFECIQSYTQSTDNFITPNNELYWSNNITYLTSQNSLNTENISGKSDILTLSNKYSFSLNIGNTLSYYNPIKQSEYLFIEQNSQEINSLNVNIKYDNGLIFESIYPDYYFNINCYIQGSTNSNIISQYITQDRNIILSDNIINEIDNNISLKTNYSIVFTYLDFLGLSFTINNKEYSEKTSYIYNGLDVQVDQTIELTINKFYKDYYNLLFNEGIIISVDYFNSNTINTIKISTIYPNINFSFICNTGKLGSFFILNKQVDFYEIKNYLDININNISYSISFSNINDSINTKLNLWLSTYINKIIEYNINIIIINNTLIFVTNKQNTNILLNISIGKSYLLGYGVNITNLISYNQGTIISSNSIKTSVNLLESDFSSGMVLSINNSKYFENNKEYKVISILNNEINLSYQGPFFEDGLLPPLNTKSSFEIDSFDSGYNIPNKVISGTESNLSTNINDIYSVNDNSFKYGTLNNSYIKSNNITIKTREFVRRPLSNYSYENPVILKFKWESDQYSEFFLYDISGNQLGTSSIYNYIGTKPLPNPVLNKVYNNNINYISLSQYQQTIFNEIRYPLNYIDSSNISNSIEPLQLFIGYNSKIEGWTSNNLLMYYCEDISFGFTSDINNIFTISNIINNNNNYGLITINYLSSYNFIQNNNGDLTGLKSGQTIQLFIKDSTNIKSKYISSNNGINLKIVSINRFQILFEYIDTIKFTNENSTINNYPSSSTTTYLSLLIKVVDRILGNFSISGQTEIEDIRYKYELDNIGKNINNDDVYIFKSYDINEQGMDWSFINKKRKEMLIVMSDIYRFIGSYKSIINSINYFGYNDLELYQYYKDINTYSKEYGNLKKVEIPNIFDNSVPGWTELDNISINFNGNDYEFTNLLNLTYNITDKQGNNILIYSLDEILIKLQGLKKWLESNIVPISNKILDITGRVDFVGTTYISHKNYITKNIKISQKLSPIDFKLNEAYLLPINSGSTVFNCVIDFILPKNSIPDYWSLNIKTYQIFREWYPFTYYNYGDLITYYNVNYQSMTSSNFMNDPRLSTNYNNWILGITYSLSDIVIYKNNIYEFIGTQSTFNPVYDINYSYNNWKNITIWKIIDYNHVQEYNEFRNNSQTYSFNFVLDTSIDPYVECEVTSDNGYGQIYTSKKNYEINSVLGYIGEGYTINFIPDEPIPPGILINVDGDVIGETYSYNTLTGSCNLNIEVNGNYIYGGIPSIYNIEGIPEVLVYNFNPSINNGNNINIPIPIGNYTLKLGVTGSSYSYNLTYSNNINNIKYPEPSAYLFDIDTNISQSFTISLTSDIHKKNQIIYLRNENFTYGDPNTLIEIETNGLPITSITSSNNSIISILGNTTYSINGAGECDITAYQDGNYLYNSVSKTLHFKVEQEKQIISYNNIGYLDIGMDPIIFTYSISSGLIPILSSSNTNVMYICTPSNINGTTISYGTNTFTYTNYIDYNTNLLVFNSTGESTLTLIQSGNNNYTYSRVDIDINVNNVTPTISNVTYDNGIIIDYSYYNWSNNINNSIQYVYHKGITQSIGTYSGLLNGSFSIPEPYIDDIKIKYNFANGNYTSYSTIYNYTYSISTTNDITPIINNTIYTNTGIDIYYSNYQLPQSNKIIDAIGYIFHIDGLPQSYTRIYDTKVTGHSINGIFNTTQSYISDITMYYEYNLDGGTSSYSNTYLCTTPYINSSDYNNSMLNIYYNNYNWSGITISNIEYTISNSLTQSIGTYSGTINGSFSVTTIPLIVYSGLTYSIELRYLFNDNTYSDYSNLFESKANIVTLWSTFDDSGDSNFEYVNAYVTSNQNVPININITLRAQSYDNSNNLNGNLYDNVTIPVGDSISNYIGFHAVNGDSYIRYVDIISISPQVYDQYLFKS